MLDSCDWNKENIYSGFWNIKLKILKITDSWTVMLEDYSLIRLKNIHCLCASKTVKILPVRFGQTIQNMEYHMMFIFLTKYSLFFHLILVLNFSVTFYHCQTDYIILLTDKVQLYFDFFSNDECLTWYVYFSSMPSKWTQQWSGACRDLLHARFS